MTSHRFSVSEYYRMGELGILDQRTELIEGLIVDMEPIGPWHADIVSLIQQVFHERANGRYAVRVQQPIDLGAHSLPQPDVALCRPARYREQHPGAADIYLVIEVADTSLDFDLAQKRDLYAAAHIPEYWVIDVQDKKLSRFLLAGHNLVEVPVPGTRICSKAFPDASIDLAELFR